MTRQVGRPKKIDGLELVTLDECIRKAQEELKLPAPPWTRRTLRNKISKGEFTRYGLYHEPQVDWNEVRRALNWKRQVG